MYSKESEKCVDRLRLYGVCTSMDTFREGLPIEPKTPRVNCEG